MTAPEMQYSFEIRVNQIDNFDGYRFDSDKIENYLNLSQEQVLQERYGAYDATEKIRRELGNLISSKTISSGFDQSNADLHNDALFVTLPTDYLYGLEERCVIEESDGSTGVAKVVPITYDEYIENIDNPFLQPYEELVWRLDYGITGVTGAKKHEIVFSNDISIVSYSVRYLRRPQDILLHHTDYQDCELDESLHNNIVNRAVSLAIRSQPQEKQINNE